ncbi:MAG TPA: MBL fold metallo-hydrolase, partial [Candidatus Eisenbacteria bacterium]|nr:MBL fold metallo-hydrolase [Candidatus Eisenbacteria bacterium]
MTLKFLGTRAFIDVATRAHRRHSAALVRHGRARVMIDAGLDWLGKLNRIRPDAIVLTHGHPDHAFGLAHGAPCPVYATAATHALLGRFPIAQRRVIAPRRAVTLGGIRFTAFPVEHSIRAPAVGYRVVAGRRALFYAPDLVAIRDRAAALHRVRLYVGDGSSLIRPIVRRRGRARFGHAAIREQLGWCAAEGVPRATFTHAGAALVRADGPA